MSILRKIQNKYIEKIRNNAIKTGNVSMATLCSIDDDYYSQHPEEEFNIYTMKKIKIKEIAVFFDGSQYRELVTMIPITAIERFTDIDPKTKETIFPGELLGKKLEELFFEIYNNAELFDHGCDPKSFQTFRHEITKAEIDAYIAQHKDIVDWCLELSILKAEAELKYLVAKREGHTEYVTRKKREEIKIHPGRGGL